jgi:hypothetical protein
VTLFLLFSFNLKSQTISYNNCDSVDRIQNFYVDFHPESTYKWYLNNGTILSQDNNRVTVVFPDTNTNFVLSVVEFNQYGCQGEVRKLIIESKSCELIWIPSAFTPNDDTVVLCFQVSLDDDGYMIEIEYIEDGIETNGTFFVPNRVELKSTLDQLHDHMLELASMPTSENAQ